MSGLFQTLNVSKSGMFAQQQYINVTSHNISNAATEGFSRQQLILQTARPQTIAGGVGQVGTGVTMQSIERTRNQFLDYQVRKETTHQGTYSVRQDYLSEIEGIFNEPSDTGVSELMSELFDAWQTLSKNPEKSDARTVVSQKAKALADELNHTYKKLNDTNVNAVSEIQSNTYEINTILDQINAINKDIITVTVAGNNPNDLMDRRDLLLDSLSEKFGIDTRNQALNGQTVKTTSGDINLVRNVDSDYISKFAFVNGITKNDDGTFNIEYYKNGDMTSNENKVVVEGVSLTDAQYNSLNETRMLVTDENGNMQITDNTGKTKVLKVGDDGKIDGSSIKAGENSLVYFASSDGTVGGLQSIHKDTESYMNQLNTLAKGLAYSMNAIHSEGHDKNTPFFVISGTTNFDNINASNIAVNSDILGNVMLINAGATSTSGSTDGTRALAIAGIRDITLNMANIEGISYDYDDFVKEHFGIDKAAGDTFTAGNPTMNAVKGGVKIEGYFKNTINTLGVQSQEATRIVKNQQSLLSGLEERRLATSGVSLDEEAVNLVQFQHAFQANAKVISTVDQLLDVVIGLVR